MFLSPGKVQSENSDKLEFDDPLNENAMLLKSQELRNEDNMVPKRARRGRRAEKKPKESREAQNVLSRAYRGETKVRSKTLRGDILRCLGSLGQHFGTLLDECLRFCRSKGSKMRPKWYRNGPRRGRRAEKKAKESREAQNVLSRTSWERSGATSFDFGGPWGRVGGVRGWTCLTSPTSCFGVVGP